MTFLIHYYYGNRLKAFQIGLGTVIRALGHNKEIMILIINDSYDWVANLSQNTTLPLDVLSITENKEMKDFILRKMHSIKNYICFIANIDLLIETGVFEVKELIELVKEIRGQNEIILSCEQYYPEIEINSDYVSSIELSNV